MKYKIELSSRAIKTLKKIDKQHQQQIIEYIGDVLSKIQNPRIVGKPLKGNLQDLWRYRIGHFRLICKINDNKLIVLVLDLGHRKNVCE